MHRLRFRLTLAITVVTTMPALIGSASAQSFGSSYTSTAEKDCRITTAGQDRSFSICQGKAGLIVLVTEDDLRQTVSVGRNRKAAENEPAASTGFGPFNSTNATIEWRAADGKPFAIIQRWLIADIDAPDKGGRPTDKGLLVVTRLPPGAVCHVAYVDVAANPNPNELARKAADDIAGDFKCGKDEVQFVGARGRAAELAKR
jgi:hypothetical protein